MKIQEILSVISKRDTQEKEKDILETEESYGLDLSGSSGTDVNFYIEKEVFDLKEKWSMFKYISDKFDYLSESNQGIQSSNQHGAHTDKSIKNISVLRDILFGGK